MVKNIVTMMSVLAFGLSLSSYAEAGKKKGEESNYEIYAPENKGRLIRKDGKYNKSLVRRAKKSLIFNWETESDSRTGSDTNTESTSKN